MASSTDGEPSVNIIEIAAALNTIPDPFVVDVCGSPAFAYFTAWRFFKIGFS